MPAPNRKAQFSIIFLTVLIDLIGFGIVIPILPLYARTFHVKEMVIGLLLGTYSCMQFIFSPVLGKISDHVGRRPVLLVSLLATSAGFAVMGFAHSIVWLFIGRIIPGISGGNITTAQAYIADITEPEERSHAMALIGAAFGLGFTFGPAIGGVLSKYSMAAPFFCASGMALCNWLLAYVRLPESLAAEHRVSPEKRAPISEVFKHGWHLPVLMGSYFFSILGFAFLTTIFALFATARFQYTPEKVGWLFAFVGFVGIIIQGGVIRQLLKRYSEKSLAVIGSALLVIGMALLPQVGSLSALLWVLALIAVGSSMVTPTLNGLASRSADRSWQGRVNGLMQSAGSLARCVGPFIAGELLSLDVDKLGQPLSYYGRTPCWAAAGILFVSFVLAMRLPAKPVTAAA